MHTSAIPLTSGAQSCEEPASDWLLDSKLECPPQRSGTVPRNALFNRLDHAALLLPVGVLLAPPGYGKTTTLAQWQCRLRERNDLTCAWLSLDEGDRDPARLAAYLGLVLVRTGAEPVPALQALMQRWRPVEPQAAATALLHTLRQLPRRLVLVLDDYDHAASSGNDELLLRLIENAGDRLHLMLATRHAGSLPLARLAAHGRLERFGADDLAFDDAEAAALLGPGTPPKLAFELRQRTEGWAVALHLAALWAAGDARKQGEIARFSGRSANLAAYLAEQVVGRLAPPLRDFLMRTAVLEHFNATLANHVRESRDSASLLSQLTHFHGLLVPLDGEYEWFRYHPLFAEYLRQQLECAHPDTAKPLRLRAAAWFASHDCVAEAVRHALHAGEPAHAAGYIAEAGTWQLVQRHGTDFTAALLGGFDKAWIGRSAALNLTQSYLHLRLGEFGHAESLLAQFRDLPAAQRAPFERDYTVIVAWLRTLFDQTCGNPNAAMQLARQAKALDEDDLLGRGTLLGLAASAALARGEFALADAQSREAQGLAQQAGSVRASNYAAIQLGQSLFQRGRLDEAEAVYAHAVARAATPEAAEALAHASRCMLARLQCEYGRYDDAADLLDGMLDAIERRDGWFDVFVAGYETALALTRISDHGGRAAAALLERIESFAQRRRLPRLLDLASAWRLDLSLDHADPGVVTRLVADSGAEAAFANALKRPQHWRHGMALGFALARWQLLCGHASTALATLRALESDCGARDDQSNLARVQVRIALVQQQRGEVEAALLPLRQALDYIARTRAWQAVVELGLPAKAMLRLARQHDPELGSGTTRALTVQALLDKLCPAEGDGDAFSTREREVLAQLARGQSNKQIARQLHLSENTIKFHLKNLYRKLAAEDRASALATAGRRGLLRG